MSNNEEFLYNKIKNLQSTVIYLASAIAAIISGSIPSGGGFGGIIEGNGPPSAPPSNPAIPWLYSDNLTGTLYTWRVLTQAWD